MDSPRIRVALDGFFLSQPATGIGQYTLHLSHDLSRVSNYMVVDLLRPEELGSPASEPNAITIQPPRLVRSPKAIKLWWEQFGVLRALSHSGADMLHIPYLAAPRMMRGKIIVTIHDLIPMIYPQYGGSIAMRLYLRLVLPAARRASLILTDSECSQQDIVRLLRIDERKVKPIPLAAGDEFQPQADAQVERQLRERWDLTGPIIFNVGGLDVRKNLATLIDAFGRALPSLDPATTLVIGGRAHTENARLYPPLEPMIKRLGLTSSVRLVGRVSDEEKRLLYQISDVYAYPSVYEGFGLTPLEAMACGLPVVASNRSSLPEVVGTGGLLVEPTPARFAAAIVSVLTDENLRRDLNQRALEQAGRFSWELTARMTRDAYLEVAGSGGR